MQIVSRASYLWGEMCDVAQLWRLPFLQLSLSIVKSQVSSGQLTTLLVHLEECWLTIPHRQIQWGLPWGRAEGCPCPGSICAEKGPVENAWLSEVCVGKWLAKGVFLIWVMYRNLSYFIYRNQIPSGWKIYLALWSWSCYLVWFNVDGVNCADELNKFCQSFCLILASH